MWAAGLFDATVTPKNLVGYSWWKSPTNWMGSEKLIQTRCLLWKITITSKRVFSFVDYQRLTMDMDTYIIYIYIYYYYLSTMKHIDHVTFLHTCQLLNQQWISCVITYLPIRKQGGMYWNYSIGGDPPTSREVSHLGGYLAMFHGQKSDCIALGDGHQSEAINMDRDVYTIFF
jgi:hypothetical protein